MSLSIISRGCGSRFGSRSRSQSDNIFTLKRSYHQQSQKQLLSLPSSKLIAPSNLNKGGRGVNFKMNVNHHQVQQCRPRSSSSNKKKNNNNSHAKKANKKISRQRQMERKLERAKKNVARIEKEQLEGDYSFDPKFAFLMLGFLPLAATAIMVAVRDDFKDDVKAIWASTMGSGSGSGTDNESESNGKN
eukprot:742993_1